MREFAVLTPLDPPAALARGTVESTLAGIALGSIDTASAAGWQGWRSHQGSLDDTLNESQIETIEKQTGALPSDYRAFLAAVGCSGAGPGYGLLVPARTDNFIVLAQAGCGVTWKLRLDDDHHGTVWVDATGSDERFEQIADSFDAWYRGWLDASVRSSDPWVQWDGSYCATASTLSQFIQGRQDRGESIEDLGSEVPPGAIKLSFDYGGGPQQIDPCQSCVSLVGRFGIGADVFAPGIFSTPR